MKEYTHMQTPDFMNLCGVENMNADMTHTWKLVTCPLCLVIGANPKMQEPSNA